MTGYIPRWFTRPQTVTHPSTNPAQRGRESNSRPVDHKSDALTITPPSQPVVLMCAAVAWFRRVGRSLMIPCLLKTPADTQKYAKASYLWRDGHGRGMLKARTTIYGNGSALLRYLQPTDTDTYYCDVFLPDDTNDTIVHNVIGTTVRVAYIITVYVIGIDVKKVESKV